MVKYRGVDRFIGRGLVTLLAWSGILVGETLLATEKSAAESVVVVANQTDSDSIFLARHYMEKRGIPETNLVLLEAPTREVISWRAFIETIYNPLQAVLVERGWIDAVVSNLVDKEGRRRYAITGHSISYLVLCRGLPLKIAHDPTRVDEATTKGLDDRYKTNRASVDAELALLAVSEYPIVSWVSNPLYKKKNPNPLQTQKVVKVTRLDGPSLASAKGLVDNALLAEKHGLMGRAYIDTHGRYLLGEEWLDRVASIILSLGYDLQIETTSRPFEQTDRFDAPILYFGWYSPTVNGPFLNAGFRFPPGAIAVHIHSFSAVTLRNSEKSWCGPLIARGATATVGNTWEPYLELTHHLDAFFEAIVEGMNLGDAVYFSLPALSWQTVAVGDPLYQPFKVSLEDQLAGLDDLTIGGGQYAVIRKMRLLREAEEVGEVIAWGERGLRKNPGLALGLELGKIYLALGQRDEAVRVLRFAQYLSYFTSDDWLPAKEIAGLLAANGEMKMALTLYQNLIDSADLPDPLLQLLLHDGAAAARRDGEIQLATQWGLHLQRFYQSEKAVDRK